MLSGSWTAVAQNPSREDTQMACEPVLICHNGPITRLFGWLACIYMFTYLTELSVPARFVFLQNQAKKQVVKSIMNAIP